MPLRCVHTAACRGQGGLWVWVKSWSMGVRGLSPTAEGQAGLLQCLPQEHPSLGPVQTVLPGVLHTVSLKENALKGAGQGQQLEVGRGKGGKVRTQCPCPGVIG